MIISNNTQFYLYGYVHIAKTVGTALEKAGFQVKGYIDKCANDLKSITDRPVYSMDNTEELSKQESVVIICLRNMISHEAIAEALNQKGFKYILYLPTALHIKPHYEKIIRTIYNQICAGIINEIEGKELPKYTDCYYKLFDARASICMQDASTVVVRCPWVLCYCSTQSVREEEAKKWGCRPWKEWDIPIAAQELYMSLVRYYDNLENTVKTVDEYLAERVEISQDNFIGLQHQHMNYSNQYINAAKLKELAGRMEILNAMAKEFNKGLGYFETAPSIAKWNERGLFNILDGQHRSAFLISRGIKYIPIRISKADYDKWYNKSVADKCIQYMCEHKIKRTKTMIPHPQFINFDSEKEWETTPILEKIQQMVCKLKLNEMNMLDISNYDSYFARNFYRMGIQKAVSYENFEQHNFVVLLNQMLYAQVDICKNIQEIVLKGKYQIVCAICPNEYIRESFDVILNECADGVVFWQSATENYELEKAHIQNNTPFKYYQKLFMSYNGKSVTEFGFFTTNIDSISAMER